MNPSGLSVFIPAYNAAATLPEVIRRIPSDLWSEIGTVTVIDDGSRDDTSGSVARLQGEFPKLRLHRFESNRGYGQAVRRGLGACRESESDFSACLHADGQYPPERLGPFLEHMRRHRLDLLQGSRHLQGTARQGGMPIYKIAAGRLLTWLENRSFGLDMTDYHSGFIMYSRKALHGIPFERLSGYFDFDLEVIACARARGMRIAELGIPTRYAEEKSHLNPVKYGLRTLRVMARYRMGKYGAA
ncbi:MAG: glycosyltransferase family 2 protein [Fibrobacteria bacterium]